MRDYKPLTVVFLGSALILTYLDSDEILNLTKEAAASIHTKTVTDGEKREGLARAMKGARFTENYPTLLSFHLYSVRETAAPPRVVCITETSGWRIPFTNVAYTSSASACSVGDYAAAALLKMNPPSHNFLY